VGPYAVGGAAADGAFDILASLAMDIYLPVVLNTTPSTIQLTLNLYMVMLGVGQVFGSSSFPSFMLPMWVVAVGIVLTVSVTAHGALARFDDIAGSAVAFYFCIQSPIVSMPEHWRSRCWTATWPGPWSVTPW